jgi:hypothetical protein
MWTSKLKLVSSSIYLVSQRLENGFRAWYFVDIKKGKESKFEKLMNSNSKFNLTDFGKVLESGYGYPEKEAKEKYLFDSNSSF